MAVMGKIKTPLVLRFTADQAEFDEHQQAVVKFPNCLSSPCMGWGDKHSILSQPWQTLSSKSFRAASNIGTTGGRRTLLSGPTSWEPSFPKRNWMAPTWRTPTYSRPTSKERR